MTPKEATILDIVAFLVFHVCILQDLNLIISILSRLAWSLHFYEAR